MNQMDRYPYLWSTFKLTLNYSFIRQNEFSVWYVVCLGRLFVPYLVQRKNIETSKFRITDLTVINSLRPSDAYASVD